MNKFLERYFYSPNVAHIALALLLLPIAMIYQVIATLKRKLSKRQEFSVPIISIGNLVLGGSGKTPVTLSLCNHFSKNAPCAIVLRGYKRESKELIVVRDLEQILNQEVSLVGDEAAMLANATNSIVIVSINRAMGIQKAISLGAKIVFLDDGFRFNFNKLNILIEPSVAPKLPFTIPSGAYREAKSAISEANLILKESDSLNEKKSDSRVYHFTRKSIVANPQRRMLLVSAIANPGRLYAFLDEVKENIVGEVFLRDHSNFDFEALKEKMQILKAQSILCTHKDAVKLKGLSLSIIELEIDFHPEVFQRIEVYLKRSAPSSTLNS